MIKRLKVETQELHDQIEKENLASLILDHSIDEASYKLLLLQNYIAYYMAEQEIKKFLPHYGAKKHMLLKKDLEQLQVPVEIPLNHISFKCHSKAEALGAAYVVEGSALGGLLLAKNLERCASLGHIERHHFFNGNKENLQDWNQFKEELEAYDFSSAEASEATQKAQETFKLFAEVFQLELLPGS